MPTSPKTGMRKASGLMELQVITIRIIMRETILIVIVLSNTKSNTNSNNNASANNSDDAFMRLHLRVFCQP